MNLLLDTHAFLWFIGGSDELSSHARELIEDEENVRYLSVASLWEMAIKVSIGKLDVPLPFTRLVRQHVAGNAIGLIPIDPEHLDEQRALPFHHRDPFDRLIIAQAIAEDVPVVSRDDAFSDYPVRVLWTARSVAGWDSLPSRHAIFNARRIGCRILSRGAQV